MFAVAGTVDLDPWLHKVHACDAIPFNDHATAEKIGAVRALSGSVHPIPEILRLLEILALVELFVTEVDPLHVQCWQRVPLAQAEPSTKPETDTATER